MLNELLKQAEKLPLVSASAANEYEEKSLLLVHSVNKKLTNIPNYNELIGGNSLQLLYDNHTSHASFMSNVLRLGLYEMLVKIVLWVYRRYQAHGFSFEYFPQELEAWRVTVQENLEEEHARQVNHIYNWLIEQHPRFVVASQELFQVPFNADNRWEDTRAAFLQNLLHGDSKSSLKLAQQVVQNSEDLKSFYMQVIQPCMQQIGMDWEEGKISVAQEHLASAIISRVMSSLYQSYVLNADKKNKKAVVTSAPNEYHEIGALMVADLLELDGWDVDYLGANTPPEDIKNMVAETKPFLLAISVTMPFNIHGLKDMIRSIKENPNIGDIRIMTGGNVFNLENRLWEKIGADGWAIDASQAVELARKWFEEAELPGVE